MTPRNEAQTPSIGRGSRGLRLLLAACCAAALALAGTGLASAQQTDPSMGTISGRVFDGSTGAPLEKATVILAFPDPGDGSEPRQEVATTGPAGDYEFGAVPAGSYTLSFIKSGYRASSLTEFEVVAGQDNVADFPMPPRATEASGDVLELDAFVVEASVVGEMMNNLELRLESDQMLNLLSAEDLSRFASSDVAEALKRVAGVNIVEGQFAIIRGLEDRYSSTLYNGAPVPSPDPDRQSVQLDLFPSEIVGDLSIAKTFVGASPSNSSGGSIDILTHVYPEQTQLSLSLGGGFEERALDRFLRFDEGNPVAASTDPVDVIESEFGASIGGRREIWGRELRLKGVVNREIDFETAEGFQESREPARARSRRGNFQRNGDLALGELSLSRGRFDFTQSEETRQLTTFVAAGMDLDGEGRHKIDGSFFYVETDNEISERRENGFFPGFDYGPLLSGNILEVAPRDLEDVVATLDSPLTQLREEQDPADGIVFFTVLDEHRSFSNERDLTVLQLNGEHDPELLEGFSSDWAFNYARATQTQSALAARIFFEPDDPVAQVPASLPTTVDQLRPGVFAVNNRGVEFNQNEIEETQYFGRFDVEYERELSAEIDLRVQAGLWYEDSERDVDSTFAVVPRFPGPALSALTGASAREVGAAVFPNAGFGLGEAGVSSFAPSQVKLSREIGAAHFGGKVTLWEDLDLLGSVRLEDLQIEASNDAFTGAVVGGSPSIFPSKFLFCDRRDNPAIPSEGVTQVPTDVTFNDQIIGVDVPIDPETGIVDRVTREEIESCINGEIDEQRVLPSAGIVYRPGFALGAIPGLGFLGDASLEGLTIRAGYSETVARPSFRELGFYVTSQPGTDDLIVGNPQLGLSDVESWDVRMEYVWGELGDLVAASFFTKKIEDPIEVIVLRDALVQDESVPSNFRVPFNNQNGADLTGFEVEARFHLGFGGLFGAASEFLDYFSLGGNYTWIEAEVERSQAEIDRTDIFFAAEEDARRFRGLEPERRLFGQPEWIANADISFDHPDWGTRITLAYFAISDVLDTAGSVALNANNEVTQFALDRFVDEFDQLDLIMRQDVELPRMPGVWTLSASIKNLTDTTRQIVFDENQTVDEIQERSFKTGRDYAFSLKYTLEF